MQFQKVYLLAPEPLNFADVSNFSTFLGKNSTFTTESYVGDFLVLFSFFVR